MKTIILLLATFISCICTAQTPGEYRVHELKALNTETERAVIAVYEELKTMGEWHKHVLAVNVKKVEENYEFKVTTIPKEDFGWLRRGKTDEVYGTLQVMNDIRVVVFGEAAGICFEKQDGTIDLPWLKPLPPLKEDEIILNGIFEPPMWTYQIEDSKYTLLGINWFDFFTE